MDSMYDCVTLFIVFGQNLNISLHELDWKEMEIFYIGSE